MKLGTGSDYTGEGQHQFTGLDFSLFTSYSFTLSRMHVNQTDERVLPGNLQSQRIFALLLKCTLSLTTSPILSLSLSLGLQRITLRR
jgi:hypothetical protein